jgi:purine-binding chemotaxis protein CheW
MKEQENSGVLLDEREALADYLDSLLQGIPAVEAPAVAPLAEPKVTEIRDPSRPIEPGVEARRAEEQSDSRTMLAPGPVEPGVPDWADSAFQCLTFSVSGLVLAVPLVKLNGIIEVEDEITPMPGHQPWFLGLTRHLEQQVKVVDIGRIVLPEGRDYAPVDPSRVILFDDSRWGIACEGETRMITLSSEGVRWRTSRSRRPWLAGTVIEHMCAILDVDALASELATGQWLTPGPGIAPRR